MGKRKKKWKKPVCVILACAGCMGIPRMNVDASAGTIQIMLEDLEVEGSRRNDIPVNLYRVGTVDEEGNPLFDSGYGIKEMPEDGESMSELSEEIAGKLKEDTACTKRTDDSGTVRFEGLEEGIYLVMFPEENAYGEVDPFLVTIPYYELVEGKVEGPKYEVSAIPKASPSREEMEEVSVKTGDTTQAEGYLIAGAGAVLTAVIIKAKK